MEPKINDVVWWFHCEASKGNVYPSWLNLCSGKIVWISPDEDIVHVYTDGFPDISIVFYGCSGMFMFASKLQAIESLKSRLSVLGDGL